MLSDEKIEEIWSTTCGNTQEELRIDFARAIEAAVLAEKQKPVKDEPVAWKVTRHLASDPYGRLPVIFQYEPVEVPPGTSVVPLYTAPPDQTAEIERLKLYNIQLECAVTNLREMGGRLRDEAADALETADKRIAGIEEAAAFNFEQYQDAAVLLCEAHKRIAELEADLHSTHARVMQNGKAAQEAAVLPEGYDGIAHDMEKMRMGLENCRLLAARHRKEDWALLILGFCAEAGVVGSVTR